MEVFQLNPKSAREQSFYLILLLNKLCFVKGSNSFPDFQEDVNTKSAIKQQLSVIIGEAVVKYSQHETTLRNADQMRGFCIDSCTRMMLLTVPLCDDNA